MPGTQGDSEGCKLHQFKRNNYFYGKLMSVRDFQTEQSYFSEKRHLINRLIHGCGLVCGFDLEHDYAAVEVSPKGTGIELKFPIGGVAIDCCGKEIVVPDGSKTALESIPSSTFVYLYLKAVDEFVEKVSAASNPSSCEEKCCPNRIAEGFDLVASDTAPAGAGTLGCPDLSAVTDAAGATAEIQKWMAGKPCPEAPDPTEPKVFLMAIKKVGNKYNVDMAKTRPHIHVVYSNRLLGAVIACHVSDFSNPHKGFEGLKVGNTKVKNKDGYVTITKQNAITLGSSVSNAKITIGESHSGITGNPHNTKHSDLKNVMACNPAGTTTTRNKHLSDSDAKKWDSAVLTINGKTPAANGDFKVEAGTGVSITTGTNKMKISSTGGGGGGGECLTGVVVFKKIGEKQTRTARVALPEKNVFYGVILGLELDQEPPLIVTGGTLIEKHVILGSTLNVAQGVLTIHLKTSDIFHPQNQIIVRWWAIPPTSVRPGIQGGRIGKIDVTDLVVDITLEKGIKMSELAKRYGVEAAKIDAALKPLITSGKITSSGAGTNRTFKVVK
jgi:hypothetical protein